jgi:preprotein translocase subunit SecF
VSTLRRIYQGGTTYDILAVARKALVVSGVLMVMCLLSLWLRGLNLGIEFEGGVVWELPSNGVSEDEIRDTLASEGLEEARIQVIGNDSFRIRAEADALATQQETTAALAEAVGVDQSEISVSEVGPSWGDEITEKARRALVIFMIVITLYLTLRFEWKMAVAALVSLVHDIILTVGIYSLFQLEVTPATVIAFLTILGYSLYDTIVVFDRVRENAQQLPSRGRTTYRTVVNLSLNQVMMRSINTSLAALLPVLAMLAVGSFAFGAVALQEFAIALLIGMLAGAYSSFFVAAPVLVVLKEREMEWAVRRRTAEASGGDDVVGAAQALAAAQYTRSAPPRPRKRTRRR